MTSTRNLKDALAAMQELGECGKETLETLKDFTGEVAQAKKLWKENNKPWLIKAGVMLLVFPEPFISDILGSTLIAAGLLKAKMQHSTLYLEDVAKTYKDVFRSIETMREKSARSL